MKCGASVARTCVKCEAELPVGAAFCFACGQPVNGASGAEPRFASPDSYTPKHLAEKILSSKRAAEGERKQVTVLFADIKSSMELLADRDPEEARELLDPMLEHMMEAVHRYEGTINQVMGDGIMALFGWPLAHEDHAVRACYAALRMQDSVKRYADDVFRAHGVTVQIRVGINSGEVVIRGIGSDLHMDYTAVGHTAHLAARMEQLALAGTILLAPATLQLAEGYVLVKKRGPVPIKGLATPMEVYELIGVEAVGSRLRASTARGLTRFVGRHNELDQLYQALERASAGHGQVVTVVGEPGVGKSRLYWEFIRSGRTQGWLILESGTVSFGKAAPYLPVINLLKAYFQIVGQDDRQKILEKVTTRLRALDSALEPTLPAIMSVLDVPVEDARWERLDPPERQQRTLDAMRYLLLRESQVRPLIVIVEDLQSIDTATQTFLDSLVQSLPFARLLLLVNYRPEYQHGWSNKACHRHLRIDPLPEESVDDLLASLLGTDKSLEPLKRELTERTEGNPLFLEESVRAHVEIKTLVGERGDYHLAQDAPVSTSIHSSSVPPTVKTILEARIDRLSPKDKRLLQTASAIGKDVPFALLKAIVERPDDDLRAGLTRLQAAEFLYEVRLFPDLEYSFKHSMTREVAYESLLRKERIALHARAAHALVTLAAGHLDEHVERVAEHAEQGELWDTALDYLERAGAKAFALYANAEAAGFFERALKVLRHLPESRATLEQAVDIRFELRNALIALCELDRIRQSLQEIEPLLTRLGDNARSARHAAFRCNYHFLAGEQRRAIEFGEAGLHRARECGDRLVQGELLYRLGQSYHLLGENRPAIALLEESLEFTVERHERNRFELSVIPAVVSRTWLVSALAECGDFRTGMTHAKRALEISEQAEHPLSQVLGWLAIGHLLRRKGELDGAIGAMERGMALCDRYALPIWRLRLLSSLGVAYACCGRLSEGLQLAEQALTDAGPMRLIVDQPMLLVHLGQASLLAGRIEDALMYGKRALEGALAHEGKGNEAWARFLIARACRASGPEAMDESTKELEAALRLAIACGARPLAAFCQTTLGEIHARRGDKAKAQEFTAAADAIYADLDMRPLSLSPTG